MPNIFTLSTLTTAFLLLLTNCTSSKISVPNLSAIYNAAAQDHGPERNPVILIPGILGSELRDPSENKIIWGKELSANANPQTAEGIRKISLPMKLGSPLSSLQDGMVSSDSVSSVRLLRTNIFGALKTYHNILGVLGVGGYYDETTAKREGVNYGKGHFTCFQFPYDWRHSSAESAAKLHDFIEEKRNYLQKVYWERYGIKKSNIKFDIVSHSMGGLVTRYFLRYGNQPLGNSGPLPKLDWRGAKSVDKVIIVSTPNLGSTDSLNSALYGLKLLPFFKRHSYPAAAIGSFPSIYELFPRPHQGTILDEATNQPVDLYSVDTWESNTWGLLSPDSEPHLAKLLPNTASPLERKKIARDHLDKCLQSAKRFHQALDRRSAKPKDLYIQLFIGDSQKTNTTATWNPKTGVYKTGGQDSGDTVVTRYSSLANLSWHSQKPTKRTLSAIPYDSAVFISDDHLGITKDKEFINNMLFTLLQKD